jgi:hypothetical protein
MVRFRLEIGLVAVAAALLGGWRYGAGWLMAVAVHELGHVLVARATTGRFPVLDLQLGAGDAYLSERPTATDGAVLAGGPLVSGLWCAALLVLEPNPPVAALAALHWFVFQVLPHPASDLGVAIRRWAVARGSSERGAFAVLSLAAALWVPLLLAALWVGVSPRAIEPWLPWAGLMVLVAYSEWPAVVHVDAYRAWTAGRLAHAVALALGRDGRRHVGLRRLGLRAALAGDDRDAVADLLRGLPVADPQGLEATQWMLRRDDPLGARRSEGLIDVLTSGAPVSPEAAEVVAEFGLYEARRGAFSSAVGLLEQAHGWGFQGMEWIRFRPEAKLLVGDPRWDALIAGGSALPPSDD